MLIVKKEEMNSYKNNLLVPFFLLLLLPFTGTTQTPTPDTTGLKLPEGFSAIIVADKLGKTRHLVVTPQNDIYVRLARPVNGKGTLLLHEENGQATVKFGFGNFGGTGIYLRDGYLYTSSNSEIFRYKVDANYQVDTNSIERIVTGMVDKGTHDTKSIMMDKEGNMYIPIGCPSNSCQEKDRQKGSLGIAGCPLLETSGGVWVFKRDQKDQTYADGIRYATGLRNVVGVDWNYQSNKLYVMQHGRDNLNTIFPDMYTTKDNAELPAECMYALNKGDNAGWPFIYYDRFQKKKIQAPEYGGDGKKEGSAEYIDPAAAYPAHMAPNALLFYTGKQFPEKYRNGAFIAFHGSWNRAPEPQAGYFVVFQPFKNGIPAGDWEVFADNFSGSPEKTANGRADHRPCGLAQGPDGSLYVTDDKNGTIFKISYDQKSSVTKTAVTKPVATKAALAKKPSTVVAKTKTPATPIAVAKVSSATNATMSAGKAVYMQHCAACHQVDGEGVGNLNPPLIKTKYVLGDKTRLINVVLKGLSQQDVDGEKYSNAMPPLNYLTDKEIANVLTYIRNSFGNKAGALTEGEVKKTRAKK
ncbi:c-type cytochrome [Niastella caeni]|uniref:C-type cytochrome n=1 Tax=Niastella caeni TaxID=2569763 RepID=A0A4S8HXI0_9BACT|nr:c-type cytochrome [Niastella caeni]THU40205.1 c-type cytochrome [Niastella caeni]